MTAAQHGPRSTYDAGHKRHASLRSHFERAQIEFGKPGPAGERALGEEDDISPLTGRRDGIVRVGKARASVVTLDEQNPQAAHEIPGKKPWSEFALGDIGRVHPV